MGLALRIVLFETYISAVTLLWWMLVGFVAIVAFLAHWAAGAVVLLFGALLFRRAKALMLTYRYRLIRRGDRVEYALPEADALAEQFATAKVLQYLRREDVSKTSLFDPELLPFYSHFYLVKTGKKNGIIPFEWIVSIELDDAL
jgi:hypothetical protein